MQQPYYEQIWVISNPERSKGVCHKSLFLTVRLLQAFCDLPTFTFIKTNSAVVHELEMDTVSQGKLHCFDLRHYAVPGY